MTTTQTAITVATLQDLQALPQWVCYNKDKVPFNPASGKGADCNDPSTWGPYEVARKAWNANRSWYAGLGFEFVKAQKITGIDLDKCLVNGELTLYAQEIIARLDSYTEYSPSGTGIHIWVRGQLSDNLAADIKADGERRIEMYDHERYFTVSGRHLEGTPDAIEERQEEISALYQETIARRQQAKLEGTPLRETRTPLPSTGDTTYGLTALRNECQDLATTPEGGRNQRLNNAAFRVGQLIAGNELTRSTAERELSEAAHRTGLSDREIEKTMNSGLEAGMKEPRTRSVDDLIYGPGAGGQGNGNGSRQPPAGGSKSTPDPQFVLSCLNEGEYGDARLFSSLFRGLVLYDHTAAEWYTWSGHWWEEDTAGKIKHLVSGRLASVYIRAGADLNTQASQQEAKAEASGDELEKEKAKEYIAKVKGLIKELSGRAFSLRQIARCKNVLNFASSFDGMGITADRWDRNRWLRAVPNGVIDLKTGVLCDGKPEDYIRTVCPTLWKGLHEPAPRWERCLQEIFEDRDPAERNELIGFLQRLLGYGITGEVIEHVFTVLYGEDGRNGKDTIQRAVSHTLGSASTAISKDVLLDAGRTRAAGAPTPHLSDLQGKCLAWANEPEKGARFNVGQIKDLSGGGDIPTRGLHEKKITKIQPSHLLILLTNHKPHADANDAAFWERLRLITFNMRFVDHPKEKNERKKDPTLWATLETEESGILAWLVRGSMDWHERGLDTPQSVLEDGARYRKEEDNLSTFLEECCIIAEGKEAKASHLYAAYEAWAKSGNIYVMNRMLFGTQLTKKKFTKKTTMKGIIYQGIGLLETNLNDPMNTSSKVFIPDELASQAIVSHTQEPTHEYYEYLKQVFPKNSSREGQKLEKPVESIHSVHSDHHEGVVNQPIEPTQGDMNTLTRYSYSTMKTLYEQVKVYVDGLQATGKWQGQLFWYGEGTGYESGWVPLREYAARVVGCRESGDERRMGAAICAMQTTLQLRPPREVEGTMVEGTL